MGKHRVPIHGPKSETIVPYITFSFEIYRFSLLHDIMSSFGPILY